MLVSNIDSKSGNTWKTALASYAKSSYYHAVWSLLTSVVPFLLLWALTYYLYQRFGWGFAILLAPISAGFLLRTFIMMHDCAHDSLFTSKKANRLTGSVLAIILFTPFSQWRHDHIGHHATAGNLSKRGVGDVPMLTRSEYVQATRLKKFEYKLTRNPYLIVVLGPFYSLIFRPRFTSKKSSTRVNNSIKLTNLIILALAIIVAFTVTIPIFIIIELPIIIIAGGAGVWLFFVQHQFNPTYWSNNKDWDFTTAALKGSSYLKLSNFLRFFTGNIGYHHVHHLNSKIPNYNLVFAHHAAQDDESTHSGIYRVPPLSLLGALKTSRLALWDLSSETLISFKQHKQLLHK